MACDAELATVLSIQSQIAMAQADMATKLTQINILNGQVQTLQMQLSGLNYQLWGAQQSLDQCRANNP